MSAVLKMKKDCVSVRITGKLSYVDWQVMRKARDMACAGKHPMRVLVEGCEQADVGGLGAIMIAQEQLGKIEIFGCSSTFAKCFKAFGICNHCTTHCAPCSR